MTKPLFFHVGFAIWYEAFYQKLQIHFLTYGFGQRPTRHYVGSSPLVKLRLLDDLRGLYVKG